MSCFFSISLYAFKTLEVLWLLNLNVSFESTLINREIEPLNSCFFKYLDVAKKDLVKIEKIQEKVFLKNINSKKNIENVDEIEKIDISEEMDRINSHLDQISKSIKSPQLSGKKINFILQEINRESNTILSKFLDKRVSRHAISLKMQAEKLREQIGNILWRILL